MKKIDLCKDRRGFFSKLLITGTGSLAFLSLSGCNSSDSTDSSVTQLTEEQKDRLFFIYQEEKVARDVYIYLGNVYSNECTFASIQLSEQRHMDAAEKLCINYGIDISMIDESELAYGEFHVDYLQELYDTLTVQGEVSLLEALKVGKIVELVDIGTLTESIDEMDMPDDIIRTYEILREGSYNHLESYEAAIAREEIT
ncbi:MAG: DUF2202 domain-containing protein [Sulfurovum sp.]|nr:DUF2202 domain-containing protein [Sulfurovum sp.]